MSELLDKQVSVQNEILKKKQLSGFTQAHGNSTLQTHCTIDISYNIKLLEKCKFGYTTCLIPSNGMVYAPINVLPHHPPPRDYMGP